MSDEPRKSDGDGADTDIEPNAADPFAATRASWAFPSFAKDFPRHPELDALVTAFARGDYASVREGAPSWPPR